MGIIIDDEELLFDIAQYIIQHNDMFEDMLFQFGYNLGFSLLTIYRKIPQKLSELFQQIRVSDDLLGLIATNFINENIQVEKLEYSLNALIDLKEEFRNLNFNYLLNNFLIMLQESRTALDHLTGKNF